MSQTLIGSYLVTSSSTSASADTSRPRPSTINTTSSSSTSSPLHLSPHLPNGSVGDAEDMDDDEGDILVHTRRLAVENESLDDALLQIQLEEEQVRARHQLARQQQQQQQLFDAHSARSEGDHNHSTRTEPAKKNESVKVRAPKSGLSNTNASDVSRFNGENSGDDRTAHSANHVKWEQMSSKTAAIDSRGDGSSSGERVFSKSSNSYKMSNKTDESSLHRENGNGLHKPLVSVSGSVGYPNKSAVDLIFQPTPAIVCTPNASMSHATSNTSQFFHNGSVRSSSVTTTTTAQQRTINVPNGSSGTARFIFDSSTNPPLISTVPKLVGDSNNNVKHSNSTTTDGNSDGTGVKIEDVTNHFDILKSSLNSHNNNLSATETEFINQLIKDISSDETQRAQESSSHHNLSLRKESPFRGSRDHRSCDSLHRNVTRSGSTKPDNWRRDDMAVEIANPVSQYTVQSPREEGSTFPGYLRPQVFSAAPCKPWMHRSTEVVDGVGAAPQQFRAYQETIIRRVVAGAGQCHVAGARHAQDTWSREPGWRQQHDSSGSLAYDSTYHEPPPPPTPRPPPPHLRQGYVPAQWQQIVPVGWHSSVPPASPYSQHHPPNYFYYSDHDYDYEARGESRGDENWWYDDQGYHRPSRHRGASNRDLSRNANNWWPTAYHSGSDSEQIMPPSAGNDYWSNQEPARGRTMLRNRDIRLLELQRRAKSERRSRPRHYGSRSQLAPHLAGYRRLVLRRPRGHRDFGLSLVAGHGLSGVTVNRVERNSAAAQAGVTAGEELVAVNGIDVRQMSGAETGRLIHATIGNLELLLYMAAAVGAGAGARSQSLMAARKGRHSSSDHIYSWHDAGGRAVSPPRHQSPSIYCVPSGAFYPAHHDHHRQQQQQRPPLKRVYVQLDMGEQLGVSVRGGADYGLGVYVSHVQQLSPAAEAGIRPGDRLVSINDQHVDHLTHDEAVSVLKYCKSLDIVVSPQGKVPFSLRVD